MHATQRQTVAGSAPDGTGCATGDVLVARLTLMSTTSPEVV